MHLALTEALKGEGSVHPNPLVGAVLVRNGRVLAKGAHEWFGGPHAEINAFKKLKKILPGTKLYVTLEPCSHFGKTPPCAEFILKKKIKEVIAAMKDPNPLVAGRGLANLKKEGVKVRVGILEDDARNLNRHYLHWVSKKMPYVTLKRAQSLDGKIATKNGESRWLSGEASRLKTQQLRKTADASLVGVNTVLKDDRQLSVRIPMEKPQGVSARQPVKIVLDAHLKTPVKSKIFSKKSGKVIIFTSKSSSIPRRSALSAHAEIIVVADKKGYLDWRQILGHLGRRGITHVLVEGGSETAASALISGIVNEVYFFIAPFFIGGKKALGALGGEGISHLSQAPRLKKWSMAKIGEDFLVHGYC